MRKLWAVIEREYLERVRTRWFLVATVFGPLLFAAVLFFPSYMAGRERPSRDVARIRILDATGTDLGRRIATELNGGILGDTTLTQLVLLDPAGLTAAEDSATRDVQSRRIKGYLVLGRALLGGGSARYAGINATAIADVRQLETIVEREVMVAKLRQAGMAAADAERLKRSRFVLRAERITPAGRGGSGRLNLLFAVSVATLLYMTILMYGQAVLRGVLEEKQTRVAEIVVSSVRPVTLLAGKVLGVGAVGLTQMLIWTITSLLMAKYRVAVLQRLGIDAAPIQLPGITPGALITLLVFFVLGYTLYAALFATVGAMVSSEQEAQQAQTPIVLLLVMSLLFLQPVLSAPDATLATTLSILPISSPIVMPLRMSAVDVPTWEVGLSLVALLSACYVTVYLAATVYRTGLLMYGKRVTVRELARWVRESK
jgi:ABC-2 type transport system permease protein